MEASLYGCVQQDKSGSDPLGLQERYGSDPTLRMTEGSIEIKHKAQLATICCDNCDLSRERKYYWVLENAYEVNYPIGFPYLPFCPCRLPPNCMCPGMDSVSKTYFDRGIFDRQGCLFKIGFFAGPASFHTGPIEKTCCCNPCCACWNNYTSCYHVACCGERVNYVISETFCFCIPTRSCWLWNCFGLFGPADGQPLLHFLLATHLAPGEGQHMMRSLEKARAEWSQKTGRGQ